MSSFFLYNIPGRFVPEAVKVRKAPSDPSKGKPFRFVPLAPNGTERVKVTRRTLSGETLAAWMAETDSDARIALLAGIDTLESASNISPTVSQLAAMRAIVDRDTLAAFLASGILIVPSDRAERAAGTTAQGRKMSEAERTSAALDALFADSEPEVTLSDVAEAAATIAPSVNPVADDASGPTPDAPVKSKKSA